MRGRAVGIDKTMKRLKNTTCGDRPLVNSVGLQSTFRLPTCSSKDHLFTESHTITPLSSRIDRRDETVRPPPPAKLGAGPRHLGRPAKLGPKSTRKWLYKITSNGDDSDGVYIIKRRKVTLIKKCATVTCLKLIKSKFD